MKGRSQVALLSVSVALGPQWIQNGDRDLF